MVIVIVINNSNYCMYFRKDHLRHLEEFVLIEVDIFWATIFLTWKPYSNLLYQIVLLQCVKKCLNIGDENIHTMSSSEIGPMLRISMLILTLVACPTITKKYNRLLVRVLMFLLCDQRIHFQSILTQKSIVQVQSFFSQFC